MNNLPPSMQRIVTAIEEAVQVNQRMYDDWRLELSAAKKENEELRKRWGIPDDEFHYIGVCIGCGRPCLEVESETGIGLCAKCDANKELNFNAGHRAGFMEACERIQKWVNEHEDYVPQEFNEEIEKMKKEAGIMVIQKHRLSDSRQS